MNDRLFYSPILQNGSTTPQIFYIEVNYWIVSRKINFTSGAGIDRCVSFLSITPACGDYLQEVWLILRDAVFFGSPTCQNGL